MPCSCRGPAARHWLWLRCMSPTCGRTVRHRPIFIQPWAVPRPLQLCRRARDDAARGGWRRCSLCGRPAGGAGRHRAGWLPGHHPLRLPAPGPGALGMQACGLPGCNCPVDCQPILEAHLDSQCLEAVRWQAAGKRQCLGRLRMTCLLAVRFPSARRPACSTPRPSSRGPTCGRCRSTSRVSMRPSQASAPSQGQAPAA